MPGCAQSTPLDLTRFSEEVRRQLYDLIRASQFTPRFDRSDPESSHAPLYTAEDAGLCVFFLAGRWFARWCRLEVPEEEPEAERVELLRITPSAESPLGVMLHES